MKFNRTLFFLFCGLVLLASPIQAAAFFGCFNDSLYLEVGPEIYWMRRWRAGGTVQTGRIDGIRAQLERIRGNSWYAGVNILYASGDLEGHNAFDFALKSEITDFIVEGRAGYTLQGCGRNCPFFTIFGGYGYFKETNDFHLPSPIPFKFTDTFNYIAAGFLSGINFTPLLSMGLNFEVRFMLNGQSEVTDDPLFEDITLLMNNETHYRIEVPINYCLHCPFLLETSLVPFYEFRHFGGREGFPFDYLDTKFSLLGARLSVAYRF